MSEHEIAKGSRGLTLLELLVSLALFVVLLSILWNAVSLFTRTQDQGTRLAEKSQFVRSLSQLLEDDLRAAIQDPIHPLKEPLVGDDDVRRFGLSGTARSLRIDVVEINPFAAPTSAGQRRATAMGDVAATEPRVPELKTVFYEMRLDGLCRREIDFETPDNAAMPSGETMSAPEVVDCRFRYFDGNNWSDEWDSLNRNGLPVAMEATIRLVAMSDARKLRRDAPGEPVDDAIQRLEIPTPSIQRIVAYLPTSPVLKHEEFQRPQPKPKPQTLPLPLPPPPPVPSPLESPSPPPPPGPQQGWIRG